MYQCPKCGEYVDNIFEHYADCKGYHILVSKRYEYKKDLATHKLIKCPSCHELYTSSSPFCVYCGWTTDYCAQCHNPIGIDDPKCLICGWDQRKWLRYRRNVSFSHSFLCSRCNEPIEDWYSHCPTCFHNLHPTKSPIIKCPRCAAEYNTNNGVCSACGWSELFCPVCDEYIDEYNMCSAHDWDLDMFIVESVNGNVTPQNAHISIKRHHATPTKQKTCNVCLQPIDETTYERLKKREAEKEDFREKREQTQFKAYIINMFIAATIGVCSLLGCFATDLWFISFLLPGIITAYILVAMYLALFHGSENDVKFFWCIPIGILAFVVSMGMNSIF